MKDRDKASSRVCRAWCSVYSPRLFIWESTAVQGVVPLGGHDDDDDSVNFFVLQQKLVILHRKKIRVDNTLLLGCK